MVETKEDVLIACAKGICSASSGGFCQSLGGDLGCRNGRGEHGSHLCVATPIQLEISGHMETARTVINIYAIDKGKPEIETSPISQANLSAKHMAGVKISDTVLPTRIKNVLFHMGMETVGDLKNLSKHRFMRSPNAGSGSLKILEKYLGRPLSSANPHIDYEKEGRKSDWVDFAKEWDKNN